MPSPFPGMDPWLERNTEWPGFHDILIVKTVEVLQPLLRNRGYYANPGERVWLTEPGRPIYPDVVTIQRRTQRPPSTDTSVALIRLRDPLPRVRIPLKSNDEDATLDMQVVFDRSYDIGPYPERLNYAAPPEPPLSDEDAAWADELLKTKGLRQ